MKVELVTINDIDSCVEFVELVKSDFAGYDKDDFLKALRTCIEQGSALMVKTDTIVIGLLLYSKKEKELQFMAVHPMHRKKGIAYALMQGMVDAFAFGDCIHVITFREKDPKGIAARACYHKFGFMDDELLEVFHYPCQKMIYYV